MKFFQKLFKKRIHKRYGINEIKIDNINIELKYNDKGNFTNIFITRNDVSHNITYVWTIPHKNKDQSIKFQNALFNLIYYEAQRIVSNEIARMEQ